MKNPRILIFASYFAPNSFSEALVNNKYALALKNANWDVTIITTSDRFENQYEDKWSSLWEPLKEHTINIPISEPNKKYKFIETFISVLYFRHWIYGMRWALKAYRLARKLHKQNPYDAIISRTISDHGHLPALKFKNLTGVKWIANWNDPPYFIFPPPYNIESKKISRFFYYIYLKSVAKRADFNTFPSERLFNFIQNELNIFNRNNIKILPHLNTNLQLEKRETKTKVFRICHTGNLSKERSPDLFLLALKELKYKYGSNIECYIIGIENVDLSLKIKELSLETSVYFTGSLSYKETLEFLSTCEIGLLIEAQSNEGIYLPSKLSDYVFMRLPFLAISPEIGTLRDLVSKFGGGIVVNNNNKDLIYEGLEEIYVKWKDGSLNSIFSQDLAYYLSDDFMLIQMEKMIQN